MEMGRTESRGRTQGDGDARDKSQTRLCTAARSKRRDCRLVATRPTLRRKRSSWSQKLEPLQERKLERKLEPVLELELDVEVPVLD